MPLATTMPSSSARSRLALVRRGLGLLVLSGVAVAPALVERQAAASIAAMTHASAVGVDIEGLHLSDAAFERGGHTLTAERLTVHPNADGLAVHIVGPALSVAAPRTQPSGETPPDPSPDPPDDSPRRVGPSVPDTHGIPVSLSVAGALPITTALATATLIDPVVRLDGHGGATISTDAAIAVADGRLTLTTHGSVVASRTDEGWLAQAMVAIGDGPPVQAIAELGAHATLSLNDGLGGTMSVRKQDSAARVEFTAWPLATIGNLAEPLYARAGLKRGSTTVNGTVTVERTESGLHASLDPMTVHGVHIDHRALAPGEVEFETLSLSGDIERHDQGYSVSAVLSHRQAQVHIAGRLDNDTADIDVTLPATPCQALLDAAPRGMSDAIVGAQLGGDIEGYLRLSVDRGALAQARAAGQFDRDAPPGALAFEFPFLDQCQVQRDPPGIDFDGLGGPYRHRFVSASGVAQTRVMAPSADGFVSLARGRMVADALMTLEDYRFFDHDGFDREQIRYAFWHNLVVGRVSRGASTISQQATRNLWLGVDRSLSRKLQEALLTARLEARVDKRRILELYLNVIELGPDVHGVGEAARFYFGREVQDLNPLQVVHLASLAPAPRRFAIDFQSGEVPAAWKTELREHLRRMRRANILTAAQLKSAMRSDLALLDRR